MSPAVTFRTRGDGRLHAPGHGVTLTLVDADACGSPLCTVDNDLFRVELADRERPWVLCPDHAEELLARERGW